jgi:hypothetical protein
MADPNYSRAEEFRRRGIQVQRRAAQITDLSIKRAFTDIVNEWFVADIEKEMSEADKKVLYAQLEEIRRKRKARAA